MTGRVVLTQQQAEARAAQAIPEAKTRETVVPTMDPHRVREG
jgi:hypothetical protein